MTRQEAPAGKGKGTTSGEHGLLEVAWVHFTQTRVLAFCSCLLCFALLWMDWGLLCLPCLVAGGLSKSSSHRFLSRSPSSTFSGFSGFMNLGSSDLTLPSSSSPGSLISHLPLRPHIAEPPPPPPPPPVSQGHRPLGTKVPSPPSLPFSSPSPRRGRLLLGYFYPRSFLKEQAARSLRQSMGLSPYGKPPLRGKESRILFWVLAWSLQSFWVPH